MSIGPSRSRRRVSRIVDVVVSTALLVLLLPLFVVVAVAIRLESRGFVICRQRRTCPEGRPFDGCVFRSTYVDEAERIEARRRREVHPDPRPWLPPDDDRSITRVGRFLRQYGIDDLPLLYNVLRGDLTLLRLFPFLSNGGERPKGLEPDELVMLAVIVLAIVLADWFPA